MGAVMVIVGGEEGRWMSCGKLAGVSGGNEEGV